MQGTAKIDERVKVRFQSWRESWLAFDLFAGLFYGFPYGYAVPHPAFS
jgi:hypothetical protein